LAAATGGIGMQSSTAQYPDSERPLGGSGSARAYGCEDVLLADNGLDGATPFCSNPACALHVRLLDLRTAGNGNWVSLADGRIFGRSRFGGLMLCDACGTQRGPVRLSGSHYARLTRF
jgi:hypothetical protein